jgi:hypothetical protein
MLMAAVTRSVLGQQLQGFLVLVSQQLRFVLSQVVLQELCGIAEFNSSTVGCLSKEH